ncbi:unnamed protein product [Tetraodon nigroviridis]|uniref:(spotted green pufferfish) hypothetical protein n=1 Tax=Tetraodon nigroviridis TaxID=99883 RepID=Q4ST53_TETNG|nr:unnamed protein product [Tetraodon nigroviridis]
MTQRSRAPKANASQAARQSSSTLVQEDEDDSLFTQPSTSQVQRGLERLSPAQVELKTAEVVQFILVKDQKKIPIRRADLIKHVLKDYKNIYPEIMRRAARTFDQVFGLKLVEIDPKNHLYILVNKLEPVEAAPPVLNPSSSKMGLLFVILSVIFMKGGAVRDSVVWNILKKLRVQPGERHPEFGEVKRVVMEEFVRQRYLECNRIPHTEPLEHEFRWGQRADTEVSKTKILEFMAELHQQDPQTWSQQYKEAQASRQQAGTSSQR